MADIFGNTDESQIPTPEAYVPLQAKYEVKTSIASDILGFTGAALGDFGVSVWNSLPTTENAETEDFLKRVDSNSLRMYEETPEAVHAASFIGGIFVPVGIAMKGMNMARAGTKGVNWFSQAGKVEAMAGTANILRESGIASSAYKDAVRNLWIRDAANIAVDNIAAELAIVGTMNAHPFMEDYMKDPVSSFTTSVLLGTAITAPLSHIGVRGDIRKQAQGIYEAAFKPVVAGFEAVDDTAAWSLAISQHQKNIDNWTGMLEKAEKGEIELNNITKNLLTDFTRKTQEQQVIAFEKMAQGELAGVDREMRDFLIKEISSDPAKFSNINKATFAYAPEEANALKDTIGKLFPSTKIPDQGEIPLTAIVKSGAKEGELRAAPVFYSQRFDAFGVKADLKNFGVAADLHQNPETLTKGFQSGWFHQPRYDAFEEAMTSSTAKIDLDFLRQMKAFDDLPVTDLSKVAVSPDDIPRLNALLTRMEKLGKEDPALAASLEVILTKNKPNWDAVEQASLRQIPIITTKDGKGVKASYLTDMKKLESDWDKMINPTQGLLSGWKNGGGMSKLRQAVDDAFRAGPYSRHGAPQAHIDEVKKIYSSAASENLRQNLMQMADSEGVVYLYRGLKRQGFGSSAVESFTTNAEKAAEFGTPKLYPVRVQDVLAGIRDIAGKAGYGRSTEILVMAPTRTAIKDLPIAERALEIPASYLSAKTFGIDVDALKLKGFDKQNIKNLTINLHEDFLSSNPLLSFKGSPEEYKTQLEAFIKAGLDSYLDDIAKFNTAKSAASTSEKMKAGYAEVEEALRTAQAVSINTLASTGLGAESIALRVGMPVDSVKAILGGVDMLQVPNRSYSNAADIGTFFTNQNRSLVFSTTANKIPVAQMRQNLLNSMAKDIDAGVKETVMAASSSSTVKGLHNFFQTMDTRARTDIIKEHLEKLTPAHLGSKFFTSTDFTLRDLGEVGNIITEMGKDAAHLKIVAANDILKPISASFGPIVKDAAGSVEFLTARNINASLRGFREFRIENGIGKFFVQDAHKPWIEINGVKIRNMIPVEYQGKIFEVKTPSVITAYDEMSKAGRELYAFNNTKRQILGLPALNDNGFWMPAFNPRDKHISYVFDRNLQTTRLLWGNTPEELIDAENAYLSTLTHTEKKNIDIIKKGVDQEAYNKIAGRHDPMFMSVANVSDLHTGASASARVSVNQGAYSDLANAYEHYIHRSVEDLLELQYSDVFAHLDNLNFAAVKNQQNNSGSKVQQALGVKTNIGSVVKNTMLAKSNLQDYTAWNQVQNGIQTAAELTLQSLSKAIQPLLDPVQGLFGKGKAGTSADYEALIKEMDLRGIPNPFQSLDDAVAREMFQVESLSQAPNMTPRIVALSNSLASTLMLRVMELGQPLVNMLSLPVLTSAAVQKNFLPEFAGSALKENFHLSTAAAMYDGMRMMGNPEYAKYRKMGQELGVMNPVVSEVSEILQLNRSFNKGAMQGVENALNSKLVELLSKPADWSEKAVREFSFATGVSLAKKAYPGLSDHGVITFARNFVDTSIGNYATAQRPAMFQGSLGVAMGLFQTYMVTLAQQIYGRLELRDYKALSKIMLAQGTIFGVKGLPGFNLVSEQIGEKFSDQNYDLTTGTYRAVGEDAGDLILYGLPSNLGPAVYTRGDIQPRLPNIAGGLQNLAAVNILKSAFDSAKTLESATRDIGNEGAAHAFAEALSVQSVSRPVARLSELFTGHSVTASGNQIAGPEEIYSVQGWAARVFATRSLQEAKAREAQYLDKMYGSLDKEQRQEASRSLKNHIRSGTLTPEIRDVLAEKYMRTGSGTGWRSAVATAMKDTDSPGVSAVRNHLSPDSPGMLMIDELD